MKDFLILGKNQAVRALLAKHEASKASLLTRIVAMLKEKLS